MLLLLLLLPAVVLVVLLSSVSNVRKVALRCFWPTVDDQDGWLTRAGSTNS